MSKYNYMSRAFAFSLLELMIVVAIVGILTTIAVPCYKKYIIKAKMLDIFTAAHYHKLQLIENRSSKIIDNPTALIEKIEYSYNKQYQYILSVTVNLDNIEIPRINNQPLELQFIGVEQEDSSLMTWRCTCSAGYGDWVGNHCAA